MRRSSRASLLARSRFQRGVALHTCGAKGPQALMVLAHAGVNCGALHPLQSFTSAAQGTASVRGSFFAIDGDPEAIEWASSIVTQVGCRSFRIRAEDRSLYHAAAVWLAITSRSRLRSRRSPEGRGVGSLDGTNRISATCENICRKLLSLGPVEALTGPIARGDTTTVRLT